MWEMFDLRAIYVNRIRSFLLIFVKLCQQAVFISEIYSDYVALSFLIYLKYWNKKFVQIFSFIGSPKFDIWT